MSGWKRTFGPREVLFEYVQQGDWMKVCAIDPDTNIEIAMNFPTSYSEETMKFWSARKLQRAIERRRARERRDGPPDPKGRRGRGILA